MLSKITEGLLTSVTGLTTDITRLNGFSFDQSISSEVRSLLSLDGVELYVNKFVFLNKPEMEISAFVASMIRIGEVLVEEDVKTRKELEDILTEFVELNKDSCDDVQANSLMEITIARVCDAFKFVPSSELTRGLCSYRPKQNLITAARIVNVGENKCVVESGNNQWTEVMSPFLEYVVGDYLVCCPHRGKYTMTKTHLETFFILNIG